jgi:peptidoglycan/LPS O-acetylase OafA/YrhL
VNRERALKVVLVLVGLLFVAAIYPAVMPLWHASPEDDTGDTMMMSLYFTLGVFLLLAARKPSAHRSLVAFAAWSSFAHAVVMTILGFHLPSEQVGFWIGSSVLVVIGVALLAVSPSRQPVDQASAAAAQRPLDHSHQSRLVSGYAVHRGTVTKIKRQTTSPTDRLVS